MSRGTVHSESTSGPEILETDQLEPYLRQLAEGATHVKKLGQGGSGLVYQASPNVEFGNND